MLVPDFRRSDDCAIMRDRLSQLVEDLRDREMQRATFARLETPDEVELLSRRLRELLTTEIDQLDQAVWMKETGRA